MLSVEPSDLHVTKFRPAVFGKISLGYRTGLTFACSQSQLLSLGSDKLNRNTKRLCTAVQLAIGGHQGCTPNRDDRQVERIKRS